MAFAQMNWGRMRYPLDDPRMREFSEALFDVYELAENHRGFIWRIPDDETTIQLSGLGFDERTSATVSVWRSVEALKDYTYRSLHGQFLERSDEWFETVKGPQLVIWEVKDASQPTFREAFERLELLKNNGSTTAAFGWPSSNNTPEQFPN